MTKRINRTAFFLFLALTSGIVVFTCFQLLRADITPLSAIDDAIIAGKQQLFSRTVSGALQAHQTLLAARDQYVSSTGNLQKLKIHFYLSLTRPADAALRNDGQGTIP